MPRVPACRCSAGSSHACRQHNINIAHAAACWINSSQSQRLRCLRRASQCQDAQIASLIDAGPLRCHQPRGGSQSSALFRREARCAGSCDERCGIAARRRRKPKRVAERELRRGSHIYQTTVRVWRPGRGREHQCARYHGLTPQVCHLAETRNSRHGRSAGWPRFGNR